jgi:hypothetical protein
MELLTLSRAVTRQLQISAHTLTLKLFHLLEATRLENTSGTQVLNTERDVKSTWVLKTMLSSCQTLTKKMHLTQSLEPVSDHQAKGVWLFLSQY